MQKSFDNPAAVAPPVGKYSHVARIEVGDAVFLMTAGQVAIDREGKLVGPGDFAAQAACVLDNIKAILEAHGASMRDIVKINIYVTDMSSRAKLTEVRTRYFGDHTPASTMVEVSQLASPDWLLEIEATAVISR